MFYVHLKYDGIARQYTCDNYFDALVLQDALERRYGAEFVTLVAIETV